MEMTWKVEYENENIWGLTARILVTISAGLNLRSFHHATIFLIIGLALL